MDRLTGRLLEGADRSAGQCDDLVRAVADDGRRPPCRRLPLACSTDRRQALE